MLFLNMMARKCIVWWSSDPQPLKEFIKLRPFTPNLFRLTPHFKVPNGTRVKCQQPQTTPSPAHTDTRNGPFFVH